MAQKEGFELFESKNRRDNYSQRRLNIVNYLIRNSVFPSSKVKCRQVPENSVRRLWGIRWGMEWGAK